MRIKRPDWKQLWNAGMARAKSIDPEKLAVVGAGTMLAAVAMQPMVDAMEIVSSPPRTDLSNSVVRASPECAKHGDAIEFTRPDGTKVRAVLKKAWEARGQA